MGKLSDQMKEENELTLNSMNMEGIAGKTCGAPHRSLEVGIARGMINDQKIMDVAEVTHDTVKDIENVLKKHRGAELRLGRGKFSLTIKADHFRDIYRAAAFAFVLYLFLFLIGALPEQLEPKKDVINKIVKIARLARVND